jgi:hypothetical protein
MSNRLSFVVRSSPIYEGTPDDIVDFEIDSESIWKRMKRLQPVLMANPQAANPDGAFVGVPVGTVRASEDAYRTGHHPQYQGKWAGLAPLLACSDCGWTGCGGIWTRIFVGPRRVFWSGLGFSGAGEGFGPIYDPTTFVFDRQKYDATLTALITQARATEDLHEKTT